MQALPDTLAERTYPMAREALVSAQIDGGCGAQGEITGRRGRLLDLLRRTAGQFSSIVAAGTARGSLSRRSAGRRQTGGGRTDYTTTAAASQVVEFFSRDNEIALNRWEIDERKTV